MKTRAWGALCLALAAWAIFATWKWRSVAAAGAGATASPLFANEAVADLERVAFLRQFADQYLNYDENGYWRNQTALAFLMEPALREKRLRELAEQRGRRRAVGFRQTARLTAIEDAGNARYALHGALEGREGDRAWKFAFRADLRLLEVPRTLENPWGIEVADMKFINADGAPVNPAGLTMKLRAPVLVAFPCLVENVETPAGLPVRIKITSLQTSEIQFVRTGELERPATVVALCRDRKFALELGAGNGTPDLFARISERDGKPRVEKAKTARKPKEAYEKTLEKELGFVIEE